MKQRIRKPWPVFSIALLALSATVVPATEIRPGVALAEVSCAAAPDKTYALYLPSGYTSKRSWPLVLAFDPEGSGPRSVEVLRAAAEEFGYIVAGSNDSRNFRPRGENFEAAAAMWRDLAERFSIDGARVYATGFSGGARVATEIALQTGVVAGVFVNGGGFREHDAVERGLPFGLVGASGSGDMNHREVEKNHRRLVRRELPTRHLTFDGGHQWAPPEIVRRAFAWFEVQAHRLESRAAEAVLVAVLFEDALAEARRVEEGGDVYRAQLEYEQLVRDFIGLLDLTAVHETVQRLAANPRAEYGKREHSRWRKTEDNERKRLARQMNKIETVMGSPAAKKAALRSLRLMLDHVRRDETSGENPRAAVARRLLNFVFTVGQEWSFRATQEGQLNKAVTFLEIAIQAYPNNPDLYVSLAAAEARRGFRTKVLQALRTAVIMGFDDGDRIRNSAAFDAMRDDTGFQEVLASLD